MHGSCCLLAVLLGLILADAAALAQFTKRPREKEVVPLGGTKILQCETNSSGVILWAKRGQTGSRTFFVIAGGQVTPDSGTPKRFSITDNSSLKITNALREDDGIYECKSLAITEPAIVSLTVRVTASPLITRPMTLPALKEGDIQQFVCSSDGGNPPPLIQWTIRSRQGLVQPLTDGIQYQVPDEKFGTTTGSLRLEMRWDLDGANIRCAAIDPIDNRTVNQPTGWRLNIKYAPRLSIVPSANMKRADESQVPETTVDVVENEDFHLNCTPQANPIATQLAWTLNGQRIHGESQSVLRIRSAKAIDGGLYTCSARNDIGSRSASIRVRVWHAPVVQMARSLRLREGVQTQLQCTVMAYPPPAEIALLNISNIEGLNTESATAEALAGLLNSPERSRILRRVLNSSNLTYVMTAVTRYERGSYACLARNRLRGGSPAWGRADTQLVVEYPPGPAKISPAPSVSIGQRLTLRCNVPDLGYPAGVISWMRDGVPLNLIEDSNLPIVDSRSATGGQESRLEFNALRIKDSARYSCRAASQLLGPGPEDSIRLRVNEPPQFLDATEAPVERSINIGGSVEFRCSARGQPRPLITWTRQVHGRMQMLYQEIEGEKPAVRQISALDGRKRIEVATSVSSYLGGATWRTDSTLRIEQLNLRDVANYTCYVKNSLAQGESSASKTLHVSLRPIIPQSWRHRARRVSSPLRGDMVTLRCPVIAWPQPKFTWARLNPNQPPGGGDPTYRELELPSQSTSTLMTVPDWIWGAHGVPTVPAFTGELRVDATEANAGVYRCTAANNQGSTSFEVELGERSAPEPVRHVVVFSVEWISGVVAWLPGYNGGAPQTFRFDLDNLGVSRTSSDDSEIEEMVTNRRRQPETAVKTTQIMNLGETNSAQNPRRHIWEAALRKALNENQPNGTAGNGLDYIQLLREQPLNALGMVESLGAWHFYNLTNLSPMTRYRLTVVARNAYGEARTDASSDGRTSYFETKDIKNFVPTDVYFSVADNVLSFKTPSQSFCVRVDVQSRTKPHTWQRVERCAHPSGGSLKLSQRGSNSPPADQITAVQVSLCYTDQPQICAEPVEAKMYGVDEESIPEMVVIILSVVCAGILLALLALLCIVLVRRSSLGGFRAQNGSGHHRSKPNGGAFASSRMGAAAAKNGLANSPLHPALRNGGRTAVAYTSSVSVGRPSGGGDTGSTKISTTDSCNALSGASKHGPMPVDLVQFEMQRSDSWRPDSRCTSPTGAGGRRASTGTPTHPDPNSNQLLMVSSTAGYADSNSETDSHTMILQGQGVSPAPSTNMATLSSTFRPGPPLVMRPNNGSATSGRSTPVAPPSVPGSNPVTSLSSNQNPYFCGTNSAAPPRLNIVDGAVPPTQTRSGADLKENDADSGYLSNERHKRVIYEVVV